MTIHQLSSAPRRPVFTVLTDRFAQRLAAFNGLTRDLRHAGVQVDRLDLERGMITISLESVEQFGRHFLSEMSGLISCKADDTTHCRTVVRGISVVWSFKAKERVL